MNALFVCVEDDVGQRGYGEVCDSFGCTYPLTIKAAIEEALIPLLRNEDPSAIDRLVTKMRGWTRRRLGDQAVVIQAISGVEIALWDLLGKSRNQSVSELLGRQRARIPVYASGTFLEEGPAQWHREFFEPCLSRGVRAVKVRIGLNYRSDLATLRALRSLLGEGIQIMVDGNEHYTLNTALRIARELHEIGVTYFEEPMPQHHREGITRLVQRSAVPIAYGEHLFTSHDFQDCLLHGRADVIQPDAAICGGIGEATRIAALASCFGVPVAPHAAAGPLAMAANLHLCAVIPNLWMLEYPFPLAEFWAQMLPEPLFGPTALQDGELAVPAGPGLGVVIDARLWERHPYQARSDVTGMPRGSVGLV